MNRERFQDLLDIRGSDLATWPGADRIAGERLIASDPGAARAFEEARRLDGLIEHSFSEPLAGNHGDVASRILAGLPKKLPAQAHQDRKLAVRPSQPETPETLDVPAHTRSAGCPGVAALSFAAALGVALGLFWAQKSTLQDSQVLIASEEEGGTDVTAVLEFQTGSAIGTF